MNGTAVAEREGLHPEDFGMLFLAVAAALSGATILFFLYRNFYDRILYLCLRGRSSAREISSGEYGMVIHEEPRDPEAPPPPLSPTHVDAIQVRKDD